MNERELIESLDALPVNCSWDPIHEMFGLSYSNYLTVPRLVLQEMPVEWQRKFVALLEELPETPVYEVRRRGHNGRYIKDPFADYRRGRLEDCK